ncbi:MAG: CHAT domain-containing protein [Chitinophagaceae bacterium]|nr:CHAT domain-containing protein [Chitinophagaceae bacterium]
MVKRLLLMLLCCTDMVYVVLQGQPAQPLPASAWFKQAETLYNLDAPTRQTDMEALGWYARVIAAGTQADRLRVIEALIKSGNIHQTYQQLEKADTFYHHALYLNAGSAKALQFDYQCFLYLGTSKYQHGIYDSARFYFEKASDADANYRGAATLPDRERLYNSLGAIYYEAANYQQALNYFTTALAQIHTGLEDYADSYTSIRSNMANCLLKMKNYDSALAILNNLNPAANLLIKQNIAHAHLEKGNYDTALQLLEAAPLPDGYAGPVALNDLGRVYAALGRYAEAEAMFDSSVTVNKKLRPDLKNKELGMSYLYRSKLAEKQGLTEEALQWNNMALQAVHFTFLPRSADALPANAEQTVSPITLFEILEHKAALLYRKYKQTQTPQMLKATVQCYLKTLEVANFMLDNFDNDEARFFFLENMQDLFDKAIPMVYEACKLDTRYQAAFACLLEGYKGQVLRRNLELNSRKASRQIPAEMLRREKELKQLYTLYLTRLNQVTSSTESGNLQARLTAFRVELSRLHQAMNRYRSQYEQNENDFSGEAVLGQMQQQLDPQTAILNYYVQGNRIYIMLIHAAGAEVRRITTGEQFAARFNAFVGKLYQTTDGLRYNGQKEAALLYHYLIEPLENELKAFENLVIIPDKYLYYLPFEALSAYGGPSKYLLRSYAISYHYSAGLFLGTTAPALPGRAHKHTLAFAPFAQNSGPLALPYSQAEVDLPGAAAYLGSKATKDRFFKEHEGYNYIHLATHASLGADSTGNYIQFAPAPRHTGSDSGKLYLQEIYNLNLQQTNLVILSACQTGGGVRVNGEGLLSLSRAFMYAGAGGIVATLYKTDDRVTAYLMRRLHYHLEKGRTVAEALRQSKIDLLETDEINSRLKSPNYWANFIYLGKLPAARRMLTIAHFWPALALMGIGLLFLGLHFRHVGFQKRKT